MAFLKYGQRRQRENFPAKSRIVSFHGDDEAWEERGLVAQNGGHVEI